MSVPVSAIHSLLRSPEVRGINFIYRGFSVTGRKFTELANRFSEVIMPHRIRVTTNPAIVGRDLARYDPDPGNDQINVRSSNILDTVTGRAVFVHECVHALQDWRGIDMRITVAESLAYVAMTWYLLNTTVSFNSLTDPPTDALVDVTRELMESYGAQNWSSPMSSSPVAMTSQQYARVRQSVIRDYGYRTGFYDFNGLGSMRRVER
jgi:hypothetical protein